MATSSKLVKAFNALPRRPKTPSGLIANTWHFDIRFVSLEPSPSHVLFLVQPGSRYAHLERLPLDRPGDLSFFPESENEAALEIARALLHSFVDNMGLNKMQQNPPSPFAPWTLMTEEPSLAAAVGTELKKMGVTKELHTVSVSSKADIRIAEESFIKFYRGFAINPTVPPPQAIMFRTQIPPLPQQELPGDDFKYACDYYQLRQNMRPPRKNIDKTGAFDLAAVQSVMADLTAISTPDVKTKADAGDMDAALDYALRLRLGYGVGVSPVASEKYLVMVAQSPKASADLKSTAHAILSKWFMDRGGDPIIARYFSSACHHAESAIRYAEEVSPRAYTASPSVLFFLAYAYRNLSPDFDVPEPFIMYKRCFQALKRRNEQMNKKEEKAEVKRMKQPNRYRCANSGCGIVADKGKMLSQCSGSCDRDKKPSYCGKECQKADWKNHKPFCKPGMPCFVIDDEGSHVLSAAGGASGSIGIRVPFADTERVFSSSTMSPTELREIRDTLAGVNTGNPNLFKSLSLDVQRI